MHIITRSRLVEFWSLHSSAKTGLLLWYKLASNASWQNLVELHEVFPSADLVGNFTVFNVGGNKYRLITLIDYTSILWTDLWCQRFQRAILEKALVVRIGFNQC